MKMGVIWNGDIGWRNENKINFKHVLMWSWCVVFGRLGTYAMTFGFFPPI